MRRRRTSCRRPNVKLEQAAKLSGRRARGRGLGVLGGSRERSYGGGGERGGS